ncbi:MAG: hypothetical protein LBR36_03075 [Bacteroidales bacterium]|jgi:hypothetical protein|nr:hypothetical protein [Bacteroidales bacterium]
MKKKQKKHHLNTQKWLYRILKTLLISALSLLFAAFTTQIMPPLIIGGVQIEFFLLIITYWGVLYVLFKKVRLWFYGFVSLLIAALSVLSIVGIAWNPNIAVNNAIDNVNSVFKHISYFQVGIRTSNTATYPHLSLQQRIQQKIDYKDSVVRDFAVKRSLLYFDEYYPKYRQICRQFALIKYIKDNYKYVNDPSDFDYFAPPTESIDLMAGDCDDYSILMASVLRAIGANVRIVWAPGHVYPELFCGNKTSFDKYVSAIYLCFETEIGNKQIYYRLDKNNNYWLNIDFTDKYPGSVYQTDEVLSFIYVK